METLKKEKEDNIIAKKGKDRIQQKEGYKIDFSKDED
jgi:hypothetical protein